MMSLHYFEKIVSLLRQDLVSDCGLESGERLDELEVKYLPLSQGIDIDRDEALKTLLVAVAREGATLGQVHLSISALNKLDPNNPINLLDLSSKSRTEKVELISNYFQFELPGQPQNNFHAATELFKTPDNVGDREHLGPDSPQSRTRSKSQQELHFEKAKNDEIEENFKEALASFELSGARGSNFLRVSIKHLMCASDEFLRDYCRDRPELQLIWLEYMLKLGQFDSAISLCENIGETALCSSIKLHKRTTRPNNLHEFLHPDICEFALADESKWNNVKQLDRLVSLCVGLHKDQSLLAELVSHCLLHNNVPLAMGIAMSLDRANLISDQFLAQSSDLPINLKRISNQESLYGSNLHLLHHLLRVMRHDISLNCDVVASACIDLGLIDDFLQLSKNAQNLSEFSLGSMIEAAERAVECGSQEVFDMIDPSLRESTLTSVVSLVRQENIRDVNIELVTLMIIVINIFLMKLDTGKQSTTIDKSLLNLEKMFNYLAANLNGLTLTASDGLIKSTNNLVIAIKSKLDALADSEIIRTSFIKIVDTVAGLCLIDARYKSAAILYSQIEDNVSAVKALMRTGEADTVMNYALLVRDITVNRITINYIKHLRLEPEVIENFISRSKL